MLVLGQVVQLGIAVYVFQKLVLLNRLILRLWWPWSKPPPFWSACLSTSRVANIPEASLLLGMKRPSAREADAHPGSGGLVIPLDGCGLANPINSLV
jgi:hypothetical protein